MCPYNIQQKIEKIVYSFNRNITFWDSVHLTGDEHTNLRSKPLPYIMMSIDLLRAIKGIHSNVEIVELGSMRFPVTPKCIKYANNPHDTISPPCCNDGHSTFFFQQLTQGWGHVTSVDISDHTETVISQSFSNLPKPDNLRFIQCDAIDYIKHRKENIDMLFLDAWDIGTPDSALLHKEAYENAKNILSEQCVVAIDDSDFRCKEGGKDKLVCQSLIRDGFRCVIRGRQTIWIKH